MCLGFADPTRRIRIAEETEEPAEEPDPIATPEPEVRRVWRTSVGEGSRIVVDGTDRVDDELCDRLGVLVVGKRVGNNARRARDEQAAVSDPPTTTETQHVKAPVSASSLASFGEDDVVPISGKMTEAGQRSC